jgi:hypothetical protein
LPITGILKKTYKQKTLETLTLYNKLEVDHLVKHGDGMGVFLNKYNENSRDLVVTERACEDYLDGFFEAVTEFYTKNPKATLKKITFVTIDPKGDKDPRLEKIFSEKLEAFKQSGTNISDAIEIKHDKAGPRFNISKYYEQGAKKLGITIAPNGDKRFLGGALYRGNVLEEQIALLSDMASIGNPNFNPEVTKKLSFFKNNDKDVYENLFYHDSKIIAFHNNIYTKFDYNKKLDENEKFTSQAFSKDKEQAKILELLTIAKHTTNAKFNINLDNNFFVAVMKVASKNQGIGSIDKKTFDKDFEIALRHLNPSSRPSNYAKIANLHEIAKDFSANFQKLSKNNNYFTAREGENGAINETGRRLFRVCTDENIEKFKHGIEHSRPLHRPTASPEQRPQRGILRDPEDYTRASNRVAFTPSTEVR